MKTRTVLIQDAPSNSSKTPYEKPVTVPVAPWEKEGREQTTSERLQDAIREGGE